eukprot:152337-Chlamydomonas_euryale.AAC.2
MSARQSLFLPPVHATLPLSYGSAPSSSSVPYAYLRVQHLLTISNDVPTQIRDNSTQPLRQPRAGCPYPPLPSCFPLFDPSSTLSPFFGSSSTLSCINPGAQIRVCSPRDSWAAAAAAIQLRRREWHQKMADEKADKLREVGGAAESVGWLGLMSGTGGGARVA